MMEDRVKKLESEVVNLRIAHAEFNGALSSLKEAVDELREVVQDLRDTMNKGRGAIWLFGIGAAGLGSVLSAILKKWLG